MGTFSTALALVATFAMLSGPGLAPLVLREISSAPGSLADILGLALQALVWTFLLAAVALFATTAILGYPRDIAVLVVLLAPLPDTRPALANLAASFNARFRLRHVAVFQVAQALVYGTIAVVVISASLGVSGLAIATVGAALCATMLALALLRAEFRVWPRLRQPPRRAWSLLWTSMPIAGINLVATVYARLDILMLSVLATSSTVALYTVPYGLVRLSYMIPSVASAAFFPLLSRRLETDRAEAEYLFFLVVRVFLFLSVPVSLLLALSSPALMPFVFGDRYSQSAAVLQIMAWTTVFSFLNYIFWYGVLAVRRERAVLVVQIVGLAVNLALNALAIPAYGASGAAAALVVSDLIVVAGQGLVVHRHLFRVPLFDLLFKPLVAGVVVVPAALLVSTWSSVGGAITGAVAYPAALLVLRSVRSKSGGR